MKTRFLFSSAFVLFAASCTQNEFEQLEQNSTSLEDANGITFVTSVGDNKSSRSDLSPYEDGTYEFNWYADQDYIGVIYKGNATINPVSSTAVSAQLGETGWYGVDLDGDETTNVPNAFRYKASASGNKGYFVAAGDNMRLILTEDAEEAMPEFIAYYPYQWGNADAADLSAEQTVKLPDLAQQNQDAYDGYGVVNNKILLVSKSTAEGEYDANDNSISRNRFNLKFERIQPVMYFKVLMDQTSVTNEKYLEDYKINFDDRLGKLKSVTLEAKGFNNGTDDVAASKLTYNNNATYGLISGEVNNGGSDAGSEITTTVANSAGLSWDANEEKAVFMAMAPVDRSEFREKNVKESVTATYEFANLKIEKTIQTSNDWIAGMWAGFPSAKGYNLSDDSYSLYVINSNEYVLEINSTEGLKDAFDKSGNVINYKKSEDGNITKSEIKHLVVKTDISTEDYKIIRQLSNLTNITLLETTEIPEGAFTGLNYLEYLNLPKVTTVADVDAFPENNYTDIYMGSYDFIDKEGTNQLEVRDRLLLKGSLERADISGTSTVGTLFIQNQYPTFTDFTKLEEIKLEDNTSVATAAFKGCIKLTTVNGTVNLNEESNSQFAGCQDLQSVKISGTVIPDAAFSGSGIVNVNDANDEAVIPTSIGESAFASTAITDINLTNAAIIGKYAFKGCTSLVGKEGLLVVGAAEHISDYAFEGCKQLNYISFTNATSIGVNILNQASGIRSIEFKKPFTVKSDVPTTSTTYFFGSVTNTKSLYCSKLQQGITFPVNGNPKLTLKGNAEGSTDVVMEFKIIDKKY